LSWGDEKKDENYQPFEHKPLAGLYKFHQNAFSGIGYSLIFNKKNIGLIIKA